MSVEVDKHRIGDICQLCTKHICRIERLICLVTVEAAPAHTFLHDLALAGVFWACEIVSFIIILEDPYIGGYIEYLVLQGLNDSLIPCSLGLFHQL